MHRPGIACNRSNVARGPVTESAIEWFSELFTLPYPSSFIIVFIFVMCLHCHFQRKELSSSDVPSVTLALWRDNFSVSDDVGI